MNKFCSLCAILGLSMAMLTGCDKKNDAIETPPEAPTRFVGADLSQWLVYKENHAIYTDNGSPIENVPQYFAQKGFNIARIRLFVAPDMQSEACQDINYVIRTARACIDAGMLICLDFHYSDTWADPGKQYTPKEWESLSVAEMAQQVYNYTRESLSRLKEEGITPAQIQIGNEITGGMLWESGRISVWDEAANTPTQWENFLSYLRNASKACREVCPNAQIIIHIDRGGDSETAIRYYQKVANIDYDIIGLSYYPFWHGSFSHLETTLQSLQKKFPQKEVMIVETAYPHQESDYGESGNAACDYPFTPEGQASYLSDLVRLLKRYDNVTGVYYWYPEETYVEPFYGRIDLHRGMFDEYTGEVLPAIKQLKDFLQ